MIAIELTVIGVAVVLDMDERERLNGISGETKNTATRPKATLTQRWELIE